MSELATKTSTNYWEKIELGDVLTLNYGKALPKAERNPSGTIPVYGANGIKDYADQALSNGPTLIIGRKGSAGQITRVDDAFWPLDVTYFTSHDQSRIDFNYLAYALSMLDLPSLARGVKPGINRIDVYALEISMPSTLDEQKRIVAVLDQAFAALDRARIHIEANLENAEELSATSISREFERVESTYGSENISELCESIIDCVNKTAPKVDYATLYKMIRTTNIKNGSLNLTNVKHVTEETYEAWTRRQIPRLGDVLLTREAPLGETAIVNTSEKIFLGQRIVSYR